MVSISRRSVSDFLGLGIVAGFVLNFIYVLRCPPSDQGKSRLRGSLWLAETMGWKPAHVVALMIAIIAGAAIGVVIGFSMSVYGHRGFPLLDWVENWPTDAKMWAAIEWERSISLAAWPVTNLAISNERCWPSRTSSARKDRNRCGYTTTTPRATTIRGRA